ncbi:sugar phosphate isomerase/epimerase family protein [Angustibacter sp. McL0619]|uniref:sugar phosphate isomerase/epimerase family protein n=1 Tax=Angustibacter sp. McL0619 TaxID=3415676 RepID=UPI003CE679FB
MAAAPTFLAACWLSAGDVVPFRGKTHSTIDIRTRIEAVARAGYVGFGVTHEDITTARDTVGLPAVAAMLADNGIDTVQLEWITDWWAMGAERQRSDVVRRNLLEAAEALDADNIKVGADDTGEPAAYEQLCEGLHDLARDAAEVGVRIGFENTPFGHVKTTEAAIRFISDVGHPNAGLILDIWHAQRGGTFYEDLPRLLDLSQLVGVELDDGHHSARGLDLEDTFDNRLLCGQGVFDVTEFIRAVQRVGWTGPWGIEHMSTVSRSQPIDEVLVQAREAALTCLSAADRGDGRVSAGPVTTEGSRR